MSETGPVINIFLDLSISIFKKPSLNLISTLLLINLFSKAATAVAQAAVPQALVSPAPLSQTFTVIFFLSIIWANVILIFSGKRPWFSILGPITFRSYSKQSLTKKIICGFPTFTQNPPSNVLLLMFKDTLLGLFLDFLSLF